MARSVDITEVGLPEQRLALAMLKLAVSDEDTDWLASEAATLWYALLTPKTSDVEQIRSAVLAHAQEVAA